MTKFRILLIIILFSFYASAQENNISGIIYDAVSKEPLIGVNVKVNNSKGGVTDFNGNYKLKLETGSHKIMYSYIGYETQLINLDITESVVKDIYLKDKNPF